MLVNIGANQQVKLGVTERDGVPFLIKVRLCVLFNLTSPKSGGRLTKRFWL